MKTILDELAPCTRRLVSVFGEVLPADPWGPCAQSLLEVEAPLDARTEPSAAVAECQGVLSGAIVRLLAPCHADDWSGLPADLLPVSGKAVLWAVALWKLGQQESPPQRPGLGPGLDARNPPGDLLALHILTGGLLERIGATLRLEPAAIAPRVAGGLRSGRFIGLYLALAAHPAGSGWRRLLDRCIGYSPLTQALYLDLAGKVQAPRLDPLLGRGGEQWISQLARSLHAMLLSPPPGFERWQQAERRRDREESPEPSRPTGLRRLQMLIRRPLATLRRRWRALLTPEHSPEQLRRELRRQYAERIVQLAALLPDGTGRHPGRTLLHLRLLDMWVRAAMADAVTGGQVSPESAAAARLEQTLFGEPGSGFSAGLDDGSLAAAVREGLRRLLTPDTDDPPGEISGEKHARILVSRFTDDEKHGVLLPSHSGPRHLPAPRALLREWCGLILHRLAEPG